jgi:hypothetical protein
MAYIRYKLSNEMHTELKKMAKKLGMKESEISRLALIDYMKSLGIIHEKISKKKLIRLR